jgi:nicotinamide-nucleotide adenylyltransferase
MRALFIGRFQPFHMGHLKAIEYVSSKVDKVVIGVGSSQKSGTAENPFTLEERGRMMEWSLENVNYTIEEIPDFGDDEKWLDYIKDKIQFDVVYTNGPNERKIFIEAGFEVEDVPFFNREEYSATEIRRRMTEGGDWIGLVPDGTKRVLEQIGGVERVKRLNRP